MTGLMLASLLVALSASPQQGSPQPTIVIAVPAEGETQQLELKDGTRAIGRVESVTGERFTFRTVSGVAMEVDRAMVQAIGPVTGRVVNGEFWTADPNPTRLFFAPTGRSGSHRRCRSIRPGPWRCRSVSCTFSTSGTLS